MQIPVETGWQEVRMSGGGAMRLYTVRPAAGAPFPAVIVLQEIFGVNAHIRDVAARIAGLGYVAVAPELFHRTAPGFECGYGDEDRRKAQQHAKAMTDIQLQSDLHAVYGWLKENTVVDDARIAAVGFCMGGRAAFLANSALPLKAAASFYGGGILPSLSARVKTQKSPILFFWGGRDMHIGPDQRRALSESMHHEQKNFVETEFSEAGHGFFCNERKTYNAPAAKQAWALTKAFIEEYI